MICFIALAVFAVLGIFSVRYREMAREAFDCVFRRITLRPCESRLDERLKAKIVGKTLQHSPAAAKFINKYFEVLSWALTILTLVSFVLAVQGLYNYYAFGNCNGPDSTGFCPFEALNGGRSVSTATLKTPSIGDSPTRGQANAPITMIEFGCFSCPNTKNVEPTVKQVLDAYNGSIRFVFKYFPIAGHENSFEGAEAAACAEEQGKFWEYHDVLLKEDDHSLPKLKEYAVRIGLDGQQFSSCLDSGKYAAKINASVAEGVSIGIAGTPTFFINNYSMQGVHPFEEFRKAIEGKLSGTLNASGSQFCTAPH